MATKNELKKLLDEQLNPARVVVFRPELARVLGSVNAALLLAQCCYWADHKPDEDDMFLHERAQWQEELACSRWELERDREVLMKLGLIGYGRFGAGARVHYWVEPTRVQALCWALNSDRCLTKPEGQPKNLLWLMDEFEKVIESEKVIATP